MNTLAMYIHWPFCKKKCPYCDFNSHVRDNVDHAAWREAYVREMTHYRALTGAREIKSVFFGGGTPSLMETRTAETIIQTIDDLWGLPKGTEITLEANPTSVEAGKLRDFKSAGINRVSLGVQSLRDKDLQQLGREHTAAEALHAVKLAAKVFDRFTFDLIYARPDQTDAMWREELVEALQYAGEHLSLYQLTIEEGTAFYTLHQRGELKVPDQDAAATLYETTQEIMEQHNMPAYEISNHAKTGAESQHNLAYWRHQDYAGIGPGAHGRLTLNGKRQATRAHRAPEIWMERVTKNSHGAHPFEEINAEKSATEMLMMGLRLKEGVSAKRFTALTGLTLEKFLDAERVQTLEKEELLTYDKQTLCATARGRQRLNSVLSYLMA